ncbi:MAG: hypothetical protein WEF50_04740 [Myxococcota bacterium]
MEKLVYLLWRFAGEDAGTFAKRVVESAGPALVRLGARGVALHVADGEADLGASVPVRDERDPFAGQASFWLASVDDRARCETVLREACARVAGYLVTESVPRDFEPRDWPDGARSPGAVMISAFPQPARLTREVFLARWHGSHTPLALEVHPLWRYVRNAVARRLTPAGPELAGIVEEHVRDARDLVDPIRFYGGPERAQRNMERILEDAKTFLDLEHVMSVVTSAYILS